MKKYGLGIALLVLAGLVLFRDSLGLHLALPFWTTVWFVLTFVTGFHRLVKLDWLASIFCFGLAFIAVNSVSDWVKFGTWNMVLSLVLLCLGLKLIFKPKKRRLAHGVGTGVIGDKGRETAFGSSTRYIHDDNFLHDSVEVVFGSSMVYFDQAIILGNKAEFHIDAAFSSVDLYLPANWQAVVELDSSMSAVNNYATGMGEKMLHITGDMAFSTLNIYYT
ncbi:LiaF transmembrane domain-containing protein [Streptococcus suis]|uniref:LiaF transmembrane domain-containing protein n=1 Tax=Streptococcus suis TaxID=1307 RepID=UPI0038BC0954